QVTTVVETALIEIGPEFGEAGAERVGVDAPGPDFAETGRIDHIADTRDRNELGRSGRMLARAPFLADRADAQLETRLARVQLTRFPGARGARKNRMAAAQQVPQRGESLVGLHGRRQYLVIRRLVALRNRHRHVRIELCL